MFLIRFRFSRNRRLFIFFSGSEHVFEIHLRKHSVEIAKMLIKSSQLKCHLIVIHNAFVMMCLEGREVIKRHNPSLLHPLNSLPYLHNRIITLKPIHNWMRGEREIWEAKQIMTFSSSVQVFTTCFVHLRFRLQVWARFHFCDMVSCCLRVQGCCLGAALGSANTCCAIVLSERVRET